VLIPILTSLSWRGKRALIPLLAFIFKKEALIEEHSFAVDIMLNL